MRILSRMVVFPMAGFLVTIGCDSGTSVVTDETNTDTLSTELPVRDVNTGVNTAIDTDTQPDSTERSTLTGDTATPTDSTEAGSTERPMLNDVRFWARSDEGVVSDSDNNVTAWSSLDGTFGAATFSQPPPTLEIAQELGSKPVIRFESSLEQWAGWAGLAIGTDGDFSLTYVARVRHDTTQINDEWYIVGNNGTTNETRGAGAFYGNWDAEQPDTAYDGFDLQPNGGTGDYTKRVNDLWRVHTYTREAATSDVRYWVDGREHTDEWASTNWNNPLGSDAIVMIGAQIFSLGDNTVQQLGNVIIAELLITSTNNVDQIPALHAAMMAEYEISGVAPQSYE